MYFCDQINHYSSLQCHMILQKSLIWWSDDQETFMIIISVENSCVKKKEIQDKWNWWTESSNELQKAFVTLNNTVQMFGVSKKIVLIFLGGINKINQYFYSARMH